MQVTTPDQPCAWCKRAPGKMIALGAEWVALCVECEAAARREHPDYPVEPDIGDRWDRLDE